MRGQRKRDDFLSAAMDIRGLFAREALFVQLQLIFEVDFVDSESQFASDAKSLAVAHITEFDFAGGLR